MEPPLPDSLGAFRSVALARMLAKKPGRALRRPSCAVPPRWDEVELSDLRRPRSVLALVLPEPVAPVVACPRRAKRCSAMPLLVVLSVLVLIGTLTSAGLCIQQQRQIEALLVQAEQRSPPAS